MKQLRRITISISVQLVALFAGMSAACAESASGRLVHWRPQAEVFSDGSWQAPQSGQFLAAGDAVKTGSEGWAAVLLADESLIQLNRNTSFLLKNVTPTAGWETRRVPLSAPGAKPAAPAGASGSSMYELQSGELWLRNKNVDTVIELKTPTVSAGIRGTELTVSVREGGETRIAVLEGIVHAENQFGFVDAGANEEVEIRPGQAPVKRILLTPEESVQWTLAVPSLTRAIAGRTTFQGPYSLLLGGQPLQALAEAEELTRRDPRSSTAWVLRSLSHLVLNDREAAAAAAGRAAVLAPDDAEAHLVHSYALQSSFMIDEATEAAARALQLDPGSALARAALARLYFGADRTADAEELLAGGPPGSAELENIRGFVQLAQRRTAAAEQSFLAAISLDPSLGEPHLGLALLYARQGRFNDAVEAISRAVVLDPRRSLFLSYWAKILYEKKRFYRALELLELAAELDPNDPTPVFYRAVILRDLNRPTEAIRSLKEAIARNDNRAVYRSRFLLDRDLASKNINLAILYRQLGLGAWAKHEAIESVKQDYSNSSAHLFLAGALFDLEGRGPAAASETLLASLLQSANLNSFNSYNEYTTFLETPDHRGQINGGVGSFDSQSSQAQAYGAVPSANFAYAVSHFHSTTDGWRNTNFNRFNSVIGQAKWDPTPDDSFTLSASLPDIESGDSPTGEFEFDSESKPDDRFQINSETFTLGYRRHLGPASDFIAFGRYEDQDGLSEFNSRLTFPREDGSIFDVLTRDEISFAIPNYVAQAQLYHRIGSHQLVTGGYHFWGEDDSRSVNRLFPVDGGEPLTEEITFREGDRNFYSYYLLDIWNVSRQVTVEGALYFDHQVRTQALTGSRFTQDELGPRLGLIYRPTVNDTLRIAAFRYLLPFFDDRTDPTDIAGLTVYRGGAEGTRTDEVAMQWEHEWSDGYLGISPFYLMRQVRTERSDEAGNLDLDKEETEGHGVQLAINQLVWEGGGLALGYSFKDTERLFAQTQLKDDQIAAVQLSHLYPSGLSLLARQTFRSFRFSGTSRPKEEIWITDAGVGYELPRKIGTVGVEIRNIFDEKFNWAVDDFVFVGRVPRRELLFTFSFNLNPL